MKVYCRDCRRREDILAFMYDDYDGCSSRLDDWFAPDHEVTERCSVLNKNNDCHNFEAKSNVIDKEEK